MAYLSLYPDSMVTFVTTILKFADQGEKTGWSYIEVSSDLASKLKPGNKKLFRVKGKIDKLSIASVSMFPRGDGSFIMAINAAMRKALAKRAGAMVRVSLQLDEKPLPINKDLLACLADEPIANKFFKSLPPSHQRYFSKWIDDAKTLGTKRIASSVDALSRKLGYGEMLRNNRNP